MSIEEIVQRLLAIPDLIESEGYTASVQEAALGFIDEFEPGRPFASLHGVTVTPGFPHDQARPFSLSVRDDSNALAVLLAAMLQLLRKVIVICNDAEQRRGWGGSERLAAAAHLCFSQNPRLADDIRLLLQQILDELKQRNASGSGSKSGVRGVKGKSAAQPGGGVRSNLMSRTEMARRLLRRHKARPRDVKDLLKRLDVYPYKGTNKKTSKWTIRTDNAEPSYKQNISKPLSPSDP